MIFVAAASDSVTGVAVCAAARASAIFVPRSPTSNEASASEGRRSTSMRSAHRAAPSALASGLVAQGAQAAPHPFGRVLGLLGEPLVGGGALVELAAVVRVPRRRRRVGRCAQVGGSFRALAAIEE